MVRTNTINLPGLGRRRRAHQGHRSRAGDVGRRQRPLLLSRSVSRRDARGRRGGAQRRLRRRAPARRDQLPELRQPRAAGDHVAVREGGRRASAPRAARSTCRSPAATSASTTRPTATPIYPTPIIGVVGLLEHADRVVGRRFQESGDAIVLLGEGRGELGGSEYLKVVHDLVRGVPPALDLEAERALQDAARRAGGRAADAVGARLLRWRPGGDGCGMLLRHRAASAPRSRSTGGSRARSRAIERRGGAVRRVGVARRSISVVPDDVTRVLERAAAAKRAGAGHRADRRQPAADRGRRRRSRSISRSTRPSGSGRRRSNSTSPSAWPENMFDKFKDECGVFGIFGHPEAANMTYLGLYALQHRGQESAGIAASDGAAGADLARDGLRRRHLRRRRRWRSCPGRSRSATCATRRPARASCSNAQPILIDCAHGQIAICHNGNLVNARELRDELVRQGSIFQSNSDTEVILHLYARSKARERRGRDRRIGVAGPGRVLARDADAGIA